MIAQPRNRIGMTAIEVLASTLLAALLMTALVGVLRGLKATEHVLELRSSEAGWKNSLDAALAADFANARTFTWTPNSLALDNANLVLQGVRQIRIGASPESTGELAAVTPASPAIAPGILSPLNSDFVVELWGQDQLLYSYRHHAP
jgi:hypothetical protein